ncbi:response regulator transcription factor [Prolixibacteraceae bacterium Z1-6]|uniref:Response regulator transcription factor n=1 Tax=Draconibacterium aestuarii TaxID=2998507 RepID=A0A9X3FB83_9BACT|nr:response regulator transcription factor [Prolixibacteraceae bacterium Z1-6]
MNDEKINIVVCDDHKLFRKGMSALLSDFDNVGEIGEAGNGVELLKLLEESETKPHLVLLDINMPEMDGIETTKYLKKQHPEIRIVVLSMEDDTQMVSFLVNEGINGYLLKNADPEELELAIRMVMKNDFYFSSSLSGAVLDSMLTKGKVEGIIKKFKFNKRELDILELICNELTAVEIAEKLSLSARTVEGYKRTLLEKSKTKNMAGLVIFAIKNKLVNIKINS